METQGQAFQYVLPIRIASGGGGAASGGQAAVRQRCSGSAGRLKRGWPKGKNDRPTARHRI